MKKKLLILGIIILLLFATFGLIANEWHLELVQTIGGETALSVRSPGSPYTFCVFEDYVRLDAFCEPDITDVEIPETFWGRPVTEIGDSCFAYNSSIVSVTLNENIEVIGHDAFEECENLQEVIGGVHVKTIFQSAFSRCENLIKVDVGNEINRIYHEAFYCCTNLKTIGEQKQLIYVEPDAFEKSGMESMIEMY